MKFSRSLLMAIASSIAVSAAGCVPNPEKECYSRPIGGSDGPWVLADHYHSRKQNPEDYVLTKSEFGYQGVFGFRRVFDHIERAGYNWTSIRSMPLSAERLEGFDVLFINLVSSDRPDFSDDEVDAILDFVEGGGGLFVIVDHTNVYRHAQRVNPFLEPMGIRVEYTIAVDYPPEYSVAGLGWIMAWNFTDHPVAADLEMVSLQTGGSMVTENQEGAVALTSEESFADYWDPEDTGGYYGDWKQTDEELEPSGPLEVVSAVEYGEGRVVVVGDQNIFGDAWAHFGDNFELAMNSFEWAAKNEDKAEKPLRDVRPKGTLIGQDQRHSDFSGGKPSKENFWVFFVNGNRDQEVTTRGSLRFENEEDALFLMNPSEEYSDEDIEDIRAYLKAGKKVVVTFEPDDISSAATGLLAALAPEFELRAGDDVYSPTDEEPVDLSPQKVEGKTFPVTSSYIGLGDIEIATYGADIADKDNDPDDFPPYLWEVTSDWGDPFVQADDGGAKIDVARIKEVDGGELIVFVQDGFFRNRSMGNYLRAPGDHNKGNHDLQYRLIDYVKVEAEEDPGMEPGVQLPPDDNPFESPTEVCR